MQDVECIDGFDAFRSFVLCAIKEQFFKVYQLHAVEDDEKISVRV